MKKKHRLFSAIWIAFIAAVLSGCDPYAESYPFLEDATWICSDPCMVLAYSGEPGGLTGAKESLSWNGMQLELDIKFRANTYCASPESVTDHDKRLFTGTWEYRDDDLVLKIDEDFLFSHEYDELVFTRTDVD